MSGTTAMISSSVGRVHILGAAFLAAGMIVVVGTALGFEHIGGYIPCKLCLEQRTPYYVGIPIALVGLIAALLKSPVAIVRGALLLVGLVMAYGLYLGVYHSGVEWAWWSGPTDCGAASTTGITTDAGNLLGALDTQTPPSCDEAAARFLGLSFAGWNVVASFFLAVAAFRFAFASRSG